MDPCLCACVDARADGRAGGHRCDDCRQGAVVAYQSGLRGLKRAEPVLPLLPPCPPSPPGHTWLAMLVAATLRSCRMRMAAPLLMQSRQFSDIVVIGASVMDMVRCIAV